MAPAKLGVPLRNDVLLEIATFLARRWSGNEKVIIILVPEKPPSAPSGRRSTISSVSLTAPSLGLELLAAACPVGLSLEASSGEAADEVLQ